MTDATWVTQVSYKTPGGALINVRADRFDEMEIALESFSGLIPAILAAEQLLMAGGHVAGSMPLSAPQQQNAAQQYTQPNQPTQPAAQQYQQPQQWQPPQQAAAPQFPPVPAADGPPPGPTPMCLHNQPAKWVKPGVSKASGKAYRGFYACAGGRDNDCGWKS